MKGSGHCRRGEDTEKHHRLQLQHGDGWPSVGLVLTKVAGGGSALSPAERAASWQGGSCVDQPLVGKGDA